MSLESDVCGDFTVVVGSHSLKLRGNKKYTGINRVCVCVCSCSGYIMRTGIQNGDMLVLKHF